MSMMIWPSAAAATITLVTRRNRIPLNPSVHDLDTLVLSHPTMPVVTRMMWNTQSTAVAIALVTRRSHIPLSPSVRNLEILLNHRTISVPSRRI